MTTEEFEVRSLTDEDEPSARTIVGWIVHSADIASAALYNLNEKDKAFDAAKRWGACITALYPAIRIHDIGNPAGDCSRIS